MSTLYNFGEEHYVEVLAGSSINEASVQAKQISKTIEKDVCFNFNGYFISTSMGSPEKMVKRYHEKIGIKE